MVPLGECSDEQLLMELARRTANKQKAMATSSDGGDDGNEGDEGDNDSSREGGSGRSQTAVGSSNVNTGSGDSARSSGGSSVKSVLHTGHRKSPTLISLHTYVLFYPHSYLQHTRSH